MLDVAHFLASGQDAAKDRRALAWLDGFPEVDRREWLFRCAIIRGADQLCEREMGSTRHEFHFYRRAEAEYHAALDKWTRPGMLIRTLEEHDQMLLELGGSAFRLVPHVGQREWEPIAHFGAWYQLWNNMRDLKEDLRMGLCYFPASHLAHHRMNDSMLRNGVAVQLRTWKPFVQFWLDEYEPQVRARAQPFIEMAGLHPTLERFRAEHLAICAEIERVFREVGFDYRAFTKAYWGR